MGRLERDQRTALVALDEIAQQTGKRPVYQKRGNVFFQTDTKKVRLSCPYKHELTQTISLARARAHPLSYIATVTHLIFKTEKFIVKRGRDIMAHVPRAPTHKLTCENSVA